MHSSSVLLACLLKEDIKFIFNITLLLLSEYSTHTPLIIIIIIKRRSGINPIPPTDKDRDYEKKQKQRKKISC